MKERLNMEHGLAAGKSGGAGRGFRVRSPFAGLGFDLAPTIARAALMRLRPLGAARPVPVLPGEALFPRGASDLLVVIGCSPRAPCSQSNTCCKEVV